MIQQIMRPDFICRLSHKINVFCFVVFLLLYLIKIISHTHNALIGFQRKEGIHTMFCVTLTNINCESCKSSPMQFGGV